MVIIGVIAYLLGLIFPEVTKAKDIIECSSNRFSTNWKTKEGSIDFFYTFSIIFPSFGGILAGSNSSGQLKRPQISIPLGSILALFIGTLIYIITTMSLTSCHDRTGLLATWRSPIQETAIFWPLVFIAIFATAVSKGVTGLGTAPMVLRCMGNDKLIHSIIANWALLISTAICFGLTMWGDLNTISFMTSMMFLMVFAFINYGLFKVSQL